MSALLLTGCGGDDDGDATTPAATATPAPAATATPAPAATATPAPAAEALTDGPDGNFRFPLEKEETWTICQGYNTPSLTHKGNLKYSLDFSIAGSSAQGSTGCSFATANESAGKPVYAPADGIIIGAGADTACIILGDTASNGANSLILGHLTLTVNSLESVKQGDQVGTLNGPDSSNGNYSHIHINAMTGARCDGDNIPLDAVFGGTANFTSDDTEQQWRGKKVKTTRD